MWGIIKVVLAVILLVFLAQLFLGFVSNLLDSNTNVRGNWRTTVEMDQAVDFHETPTSDFLDFVPRPVYRIAVDAKDKAVRLYEEGKAAVLRALPAKR